MPIPGSADLGKPAVLIASPLEEKHVARIADAGDGQVRVLYEPNLLPSPRYEGDHDGIPRSLSAADIERWNALVSEAEVMFDFDWHEPALLAERAPRLRWVQATSAGIGEHLSRTGLISTDITFTTAAGVHGTALAEFVALAVLYFTKDVVLLRRQQAERRWERHTMRALAGQRALVVGLGEVGRGIALRLSALGVDVWGVRRRPRHVPEGVSHTVSPNALLATLPDVDVLVLACPLTDETRGLIGAPELAALQPSACLVNVSRGPVIDEEALIEVLQHRRIAGAALDVFLDEPLPPTNRLWGMDNVLISPHSASTVPDENGRIVDIFIDNLHRFLQQRPLRNVFDRTRGY